MVATNLRSTSDHTEVIDEALQKELASNRMAGPYTNPPYPNLRCSGVGVVPKKDGSWRLVRVSYRIFSLGGDVVCGLTGMGEYFSQVTPRNGAKSIVVLFC